MRRGAVLAALLALLVVPRAEAAPTVPAPTLAITVKAQGQSLPKSTVDGAWKVGNPGENAQLVLTVRNAAGMVTVIDAVWTSQVFRVFPKIPAFQYQLENAHDGAPTSSMPAFYSSGYRYRNVGGAWTRWFDKAEVYQAGIPHQTRFSDPTVTFEKGRRTPVQFQFRIHTEIADTSVDQQMWSVLANV